VHAQGKEGRIFIHGVNLIYASLIEFCCWQMQPSAPSRSLGRENINGEDDMHVCLDFFADLNVNSDSSLPEGPPLQPSQTNNLFEVHLSIPVLLFFYTGIKVNSL